MKTPVWALAGTPAKLAASIPQASDLPSQKDMRFMAPSLILVRVTPAPSRAPRLNRFTLTGRAACTRVAMAEERRHGFSVESAQLADYKRDDLHAREQYLGPKIIRYYLSG